MEDNSEVLTHDKVAVVHDWLSTPAGSEQVLETILEIFPDAPLFTLVYNRENFVDSPIAIRKINTSFIQNLPFRKTRYRSYLPLFPIAIEQFDLSSFDLIISSSHAVAKGVITGPDQLHISYVHSPIRYAWDLQHQYLKEAGLTRGIKSWLARWVLHKIRIWDYRTANGVDAFVVNSAYIGRRIEKIYRRESTVIHPPVDVERFIAYSQKEDYYLTVSRFVPYKKVRLIVEAFSQMPEKQLKIVGDGPEYKKVAKRLPPNVELLGRQDFASLLILMQRAKAFVYAAEEDFGIVAVEAQSCGTPVICYGKGGLLETVINGKTGLLFAHQTAGSIIDSIARFEDTGVKWSADEISNHARQFSKDRFRRQFTDFVCLTLDR